MTATVLGLLILLGCWSGAPAREVEFVYVRPVLPLRDCPAVLSLTRELLDAEPMSDQCPAVGHGNNYWWCRFKDADFLATSYRDVLLEVVQVCGGLP